MNAHGVSMYLQTVRLAVNNYRNGSGSLGQLATTIESFAQQDDSDELLAIAYPFYSALEQINADAIERGNKLGASERDEIEGIISDFIRTLEAIASES
jgi:hypothetical protein